MSPEWESPDCKAYEFEALASLESAVASVHGYLSSCICVVGVLLNLINCAVLTRSAMRNPFNVILTGICVCDVVKMTTYTYYAIYLYIVTAPTPDVSHSRLGIQLILVHNVLSIVAHVIGTLFTVALAFFRFIAVYFPTDGPTWCSMRRTKYCLAGIVIVSFLATVPNSFIFELNNRGENGTEFWWFDVYDWVRVKKIEKLNMYIYGIFVKMTSSLLNCVFSGMLLYTLRQIRIRRKRLKADRVRCKEARSLREHTRTTILLVAVVFSFTLTEFPQGCLNLAAAMNDCIFMTVYVQVGNLMDTLVVLNSATNFFWLYGMSSQFRDAFRSLLLPQFLLVRRQKRPKQRQQVNYVELAAANEKAASRRQRGTAEAEQTL